MLRWNIESTSLTSSHCICFQMEEEPRCCLYQDILTANCILPTLKRMLPSYSAALHQKRNSYHPRLPDTSNASLVTRKDLAACDYSNGELPTVGVLNYGLIRPTARSLVYALTTIGHVAFIKASQPRLRSFDKGMPQKPT